MAQAATLVLKDKDAVSVNYYPVLVATGAKARYEDRTNAKLSLQSHATLTFADQSTSPYRRVGMTVDYHTEDAATGTVDTSYFDFSFRLNKKQSLNDFKQLAARARAAIDDAIVTAAIENGETPW